MTLKFLRRILLTLLFASLSAAFTAGVAHAQLPFGDLTPSEPKEDQEEVLNDGDGDGAPFGPVEQEGPMRPVDRPTARPPERPTDDEFGDDDDAPEQSVEVKERFAGWEQVGDIDGARLSDTLRANWVMLDRNGQFSGTVRGIDGAEVAGMTIFLMNNGRLVKTAAVQEDGSFVFTNVQRGAYSFVGWGNKAFFAFGANIINESPDADSSTPRTINCYAFQNETTINTDWIRYFAPNISYRVFGRYSSGEGPDDPDQLYGFEGLTENAVAAEPATSIGGAPVGIDSRGRLVGRVHQMNSINGRPVDLRSTKVMLLKEDNVIASTTTDNFGIFQFTGVQAGGYGLVAVGVDGVGSVGIQVAGRDSEVLDEEGNADEAEVAPFDFTMVSAETVGWMNHYADEVAYRQAILSPRRELPARPDAVDPVCPGCMGILGANGCPQCGRGQANAAVCNSPCTTYQQWAANGCANREQKPVWLRIGERVRDGIQEADDRFEEAFYGSSGDRVLQELNAGGAGAGFNQVPNGGSGGFQQRTFNDGGFNQAPAGGFQGGGGGGSTSRNSLPPIIQPNAVRPAPIARGQQRIR